MSDVFYLFLGNNARSQTNPVRAWQESREYLILEYRRIQVTDSIIFLLFVRLSFHVMVTTRVRQPAHV
jgi:hypothetical protein